MLSRVKNKIKRTIHEIIGERSIVGYQKELDRQKNPYKQWIMANELEKTKSSQISFPNVTVIDYQSCGSDFNLQHIETDYIIFKNANGELAQHAKKKVIETFLPTGAIILYADEDMMDMARGRSNPWFKPGWSPNTLLSFFYFGNIFAVKTGQVSQIPWKHEEDYRVNLYDFILKASEIAGIKPVHIDSILYHNYLKKDQEFPPFWGDAHTFTKIKKEAEIRRAYPQEKEEGLVSIIIPSKDNPNLLDQCLSSIIAKANYPNYEILVIDNGSRQGNRLRITALQHRYEFTYLFQPMDFNFSKMCNLGVKEAKGKFYLFLNDDIEIKEINWLSKMVEKARLPEIGAVGAKLLYPDTNRIQHIGVTNLEVGPVHKLAGLLDENIHYYGQNRFQYDMIGVTAACLLIEREKYHKIGGFLEDLKIAYNDVEFCFRLLDAGYYNLQCNDVVLYHHESFSRGDDRENLHSYKRLLEEKDKLYRYHTNYKNYDPFYSKHLIGNSPLYECNYLYEFQERENYSLVKDYASSNRYTEETSYKKEIEQDFTSETLIPKQFKMPKEIQEIQVTIDFAGIEPQINIEDAKGYLIEGWSYLRGCHNDQYRRWIILEREGSRPIQVSLLNRYRKDVVAILPEERHVELAGFVARIPNGKLTAGEYKVGLLTKNLITRRKFYIRTNALFTVVEDIE